jgi:uncharacterized protein YajQ (UPF0234 family)
MSPILTASQARAIAIERAFYWRDYMPSFDVVSELDKHEVTNAVENAVKELDRRYDLKGKGTFEFKEKDLTVNLTAEADFQLEAMIEILKLSLVKRKIDVQCLEVKDAYASGKLMKQEAVLKEGIDKELAKKIVAHVKDAKLKVQASIQGEQVRITGKKRDDLQEAIAALRAKTFDMPLQFNNFRD